MGGGGFWKGFNIGEGVVKEMIEEKFRGFGLMCI